MVISDPIPSTTENSTATSTDLNTDDTTTARPDTNDTTANIDTTDTTTISLNTDTAKTTEITDTTNSVHDTTEINSGSTEPENDLQAGEAPLYAIGICVGLVVILSTAILTIVFLICCARMENFRRGRKVSAHNLGMCYKYIAV